MYMYSVQQVSVLPTSQAVGKKGVWRWSVPVPCPAGGRKGGPNSIFSPVLSLSPRPPSGKLLFLFFCLPLLLCSGCSLPFPPPSSPTAHPPTPPPPPEISQKCSVFSPGAIEMIGTRNQSNHEAASKRMSQPVSNALTCYAEMPLLWTDGGVLREAPKPNQGCRSDWSHPVGSFVLALFQAMPRHKRSKNQHTQPKPS